jgi:hypothetical protein
MPYLGTAMTNEIGGEENGAFEITREATGDVKIGGEEIGGEENGAFEINREAFGDVKIDGEEQTP